MLNVIFLGGEDVSARIDISKKLVQLGCNVSIIGTEAEDIFIQNSIEYKRIALNREFNIFDDLKSLKSIRTILKGISQETIVHAFDTKFTILLPIAAYGLPKVKVVRTINGMGRIFTEESIKNKILSVVYKIIQTIIKKKVDYTIFQNSDNFQYFIKNSLVDSSKSSVIKGSGINLENFTREDENSKTELLIKELKINPSFPTFILISRLIVQKGVLNYLEAAKRCNENGYQFNFLLVGQIDTNDDAVPKEEIENYSKYVNYIGKRSDVKNLLSVSDVFVLPSYYSEGVPRVLLEASAMGLALISTRMPGCNDVVEEGFNGKMVNIKDSDDLYEKMIEIVSDKEILTAYKENSIKQVQEFSLDVVTTKCLEVYKKIIN